MVIICRALDDQYRALEVLATRDGQVGKLLGRGRVDEAVLEEGDGRVGGEELGDELQERRVAPGDLLHQCHELDAVGGEDVGKGHARVDGLDTWLRAEARGTTR